uniref:Uncharacterized protein n=1 Tax=Heterorhabditis bacteriophora TaxID=37862 RepID=A0A1I7X835_HETBA
MDMNFILRWFLVLFLNIYSGGGYTQSNGGYATG